jgi:hypothetical protein
MAIPHDDLQTAVTGYLLGLAPKKLPEYITGPNRLQILARQADLELSWDDQTWQGRLKIKSPQVRVQLEVWLAEHTKLLSQEAGQYSFSRP